jgi:hypothetical protein
VAAHRRRHTSITYSKTQNTQTNVLLSAKARDNELDARESKLLQDQPDQPHRTP